MTKDLEPVPNIADADPVKVRIWIDALRSGKYERTEGQLREARGLSYCYCALGVAVEVLAPELWATEDSQFDALGDTYSDLGPLIGLPLSVGRETACHIWRRSDLGWTFGEIADHLEFSMDPSPSP